MTFLLLAERTPENSRVLVLGAGGGLELKVFAQDHVGWTFDGVDPSPEMLKLAEETLGALAPRVRLHKGYIDDAPVGLFDAACCLLTLHFLPIKERFRTLAEVHRRLRPGAPFVVAHLSVPQAEGDRELWMSRYAAFIHSSGVSLEKATNAAASVEKLLTILTPEQDEFALKEAGFSNVSLFYTGFTFRGWVANA